MNFRLILNIIGTVLIFLSLFMIFPICVSLIYKQSDIIQLAESLFITFVSGATLYLFTRKHKREEIKHREAFVIVTISWVIVAFFGSIPFMLTETFHSFTNAYFEAMSGFTTTGASVLEDVEAVPKGTLFWRSLTHWMGGMGIILFALAILPFLGAGGAQLFKAEAPEITVDKLRPRIIDTAKALWYIYIILTAIAATFYIAGGMDIFDALCHAFSTLATGGFSTKNASIAHFQSPFIEYAATLFMFMAGINYSLYFYLFRGYPSRLLKSGEFRFYLAIACIAVFLVTLFNMGSSYKYLWESLRYSAFQVVSILSATGFSTADYEKWASFSQVLLWILMFCGGMIGSTSGGMKQVRVLLMIKQGYRELYQLIHPRAVTFVKLDGKILSKETLDSIWGFLFLFLFIYVLATIGMTTVGVDLTTSATTVISAMSSVGPALGEAGPAENYASIPDAGKWILIFCMLTGRLEVYTVLILLVPNFWKK